MGFHNPSYLGISSTNSLLIHDSHRFQHGGYFPTFRIPRASIHCVIMSLRALHLLVAVHALVAHLGQSPRCVTSADISDFQEPSSSTGRRELTILLWKLTTREFGIEVRGSILRSIFREAHYCQQVEAQLGPHCGGWFGLNLQKRFPHST